VFDKVKTASLDSFVLTIGGDHSIGSATILAMLSSHPNLGVIWVDAHGDCNTPESSESKNYHGMPAAHAMGWFKKMTPGFEWMKGLCHLPEHRLVYIGLRDLDVKERELLRNSKVHIFTMRDVDRLGISGVMTSALQYLSSGPIHLSFDIDAIDPSVAPGTGTLARGGLSYRESHFICDSLGQTGRLVSMDMAEVNPKLDSATNQHLHGDDPSIKTDLPTVRLAIELITLALGKTIL
jgi:arginase